MTNSLWCIVTPLHRVASFAMEKRLRSPTQRRRECGTLCDILRFKIRRGVDTMSLLGILGTVHGDYEKRIQFGYSAELLQKVILDFKPDIICGEVRPEDWQKHQIDKNYAGYLGPFEYRNIILPLCEKNDIVFEPVDWFEDDLINYDFDMHISKEELEGLYNCINELNNKLFEIGKSSSLPYNSFEMNEHIKAKYIKMRDIIPIEDLVTWEARNHIMLARIRRVADVSTDKRILCTVGFEHTYFYYEQLIKCGYNVKFPVC